MLARDIQRDVLVLGGGIIALWWMISFYSVTFRYKRSFAQDGPVNQVIVSLLIMLEKYFYLPLAAHLNSHFEIGSHPSIFFRLPLCPSHFREARRSCTSAFELFEPGLV